MPLKVLPFLHLTVHAEWKRSSSTLFFSCSVPVFTSSVLPPSAHTHCPHISLDLNVNMNEKTWRASDSLFPASDSDHALISTDLVLFSCGGVERDKVDHTGRSDTGDEAMMGKSRRWNRLRHRTVIDRRMKVSVSARDKGLCISELFPLSLTVIPPVRLCKCMSHTQRSGRVHNQDWVPVKDEVIPSPSTRADILTMASTVFPVFPLNESHIWYNANAHIEVSVALRIRTMNHRTHTAPTGLWYRRKQTSHCISFSVCWCMSVAIYWYLTGQLAPAAVD